MKMQVLGAVLAASVCGQVALAQSEVHAIGIRLGGRLLKFDPAVPANTQVGMLAIAPRSIFALDFNADGSTLYAIDYPGSAIPDCKLGTLDFATATFTTLAPITGAGALETNFSDLSFDPSTGTWYCCSTTTLYTINIATGATTLVGPFSGVVGAAIIDATIDNNGVMYGHDFAADQIVTINKATGALTVLGPTGFLANFAQGMDVDPATNKIYNHIYIGGGVAHWVSVTPAPFAVTTILTTTPWNDELEFAIKGTEAECYPDCDNDGVLTLADFGCFQTAFALGNMYADCNNDLVLNLADFGCFQTSFAIGCP